MSETKTAEVNLNREDSIQLSRMIEEIVAREALSKCKSFEELHEVEDANTIGGLDGYYGELSETIGVEKASEAVNGIIEAVNAWLSYKFS